MIKFLYGNSRLGTEQTKPKTNMFIKIYKTISPYLVPALLALTMFFAFKPAETVIVEKPMVSTITETIVLPASIDTMYVTLTDTLYTNTTVLDTVYLPGQTIGVPVASADTTFIFLSSTKDVLIEAKVGVAAKYYYQPINKFELSSRLLDVQLFLPERYTKTTYIGVGGYFNRNRLGATTLILHKTNVFMAGYDGNGILLSYNKLF